ncbi:MAG: sensor histidine kinase [Bifidobacterium sp.]|uniref:Oxygen sensor histidine kinase NreB n=1 Tax=Bifidobacterium fermentum TaxID=3059035 RepID=A0AB39U9F4_9BIFI
MATMHADMLRKCWRGLRPHASTGVAGEAKAVQLRWNVYFAVATPLLAILVASVSKLSLGPRLFVSLLICIPTMLYPIARPRYRSPNARYRTKGGTRAWCFAAMAVICTALAVHMDGNAFYSQFYVIPQLFIVFDYWHAISTVIVTNLAIIALGALDIGQRTSQSWGSLLVSSCISVFFSAMIGSAIDKLDMVNKHNALLLHELEKDQVKIRRLSRSEGMIAERQRIAGEMHDTIAQSLSSILALARVAKIEVNSEHTEQALRHLSMIEMASQQGLDDSRRLIADTTPSSLEGSGLQTALTRTVDTFAKSHGPDCVGMPSDEGSATDPRTCAMDVKLSIKDRLPELQAQEQVAILRIMQESLANIHKHSRASHVTIGIGIVSSPGPSRQSMQRQTKEDPSGEFRMVVTDDGIGFDYDALQDMRRKHGPDSSGRHFGLIDMRRRAEQLGGSLEVESNNGRGTSITVILPIHAVRRADDESSDDEQTSVGKVGKK